MGLGHGPEAGSEQPARRKEGTAACSWCRGAECCGGGWCEAGGQAPRAREPELTLQGAGRKALGQIPHLSPCTSRCCPADGVTWVLVPATGVLLSLGLRCHRARLLRHDGRGHWDVDALRAQVTCQPFHLDGKVRSTPGRVTVPADCWLAGVGVGAGPGLWVSSGGGREAELARGRVSEQAR